MAALSFGQKSFFSQRSAVTGRGTRTNGCCVSSQSGVSITPPPKHSEHCGRRDRKDVRAGQERESVEHWVPGMTWLLNS